MSYSYAVSSDRNERIVVYRAGSKTRPSFDDDVNTDKGPTFDDDVNTVKGKQVFCKRLSTFMKFCRYIYELHPYLHP